MFKKKYRDPKWLTEYVKKYMKGYSLNLCCGMSELGSVRVDIDSKVKNDFESIIEKKSNVIISNYFTSNPYNRYLFNVHSEKIMPLIVDVTYKNKKNIRIWVYRPDESGRRRLNSELKP